VLCLLAATAVGAATAAHATNIALEPGHAYRVAGTQEIVGRDGDDLFVGVLGYNGRVVPSSLWMRQNATVVVVGRNPSGALGSPPRSAQILFATVPSVPAIGALPAFRIDGVTDVGEDRFDLAYGIGLTLHTFVNGSPAAPVVRSNVSGATGLIVPGSPVGVVSPTDLRVGNASNATIAYQAQQPFALPSAEVVGRAENAVKAAGDSVNETLSYMNSARVNPNFRKNYRRTYHALNSELTGVKSAFALDDYKGAAGATARLRQLGGQLKGTDTALIKTVKLTSAAKKLLEKTKQTEASVEAAIKQLQLM